MLEKHPQIKVNTLHYKNVILNSFYFSGRISGFPPQTCMYSVLSHQPRPQGLLLVQNGGRRHPWPRLPKWLRKFVRISSRKHYEMSSFCLNNGYRLEKTNRAARRWKQPPKKPFHLVSRDKIFNDSWSVEYLRPPF